MRVIAGLHKGRRLEAPPGRIARPTADRVRQALFDILAHSDLVELDGAVVVDAFAGSGALGLEALSRGAAHASFLELDAQSLAAIYANIKALKEDGRTTVTRADAAKPPAATRSCTLAFLDPPYQSGLATPCLEGLAARGWLADQALAVVEVAVDEAFTPPQGFEVADERERGAARLVFLVWTGKTA
ncbi:16S rRNA (guanine(966)-N(2))-methyltransferase RsmD [Paramagnetospirillum kuznetsovii]|uniref:16S rRNA (Guanine(966)-N(2))-methyltransferase RsmD n=1 Tax=Paramagnetospirillum kuznetsovii TaxID=2053833 RepID=A0A364P0J8_9PROT|nr:16S rRNA (guanine(966)-N(2))-methyltransferase RsmD [Paramagnetospirillum kuznetsovii]RAU22868.1 16S rRNA (guanine(966)-N(2))-methyltransferase RsmD [Paramagnetospirillum kuznetsovii]